MGFGFAAITGVASGDVERRAVAMAEESACFSLGSYAARLNTTSSVLLDGILEGILGGGADLDVLSYTGLVNANVSLLDIALQLGLGSVDELLGTSVNAGTLLIAAANVLQADGTSHANILNMVGASLGGLTINIADLIDADPGVRRGLSSTSVLGLPVNGTTAIRANVASARGTLTDIICGSETAADPSGEDVQVTSGLVGASAEVNLTINATTDNSTNVGGLIGGITSLLNLLGLNRIASIEIHGAIGLKVETGDPSTVKNAQIRVPNNPADWSDPVPVGSGDIGINTASVTTTNNTLTVTAKNFLGLNVSLNATQTLGIITNLISSITSNVMNPLVTALDTNILRPLLDALGVEVGGTDVFGQRPFCSEPSLVG